MPSLCPSIVLGKSVLQFGDRSTLRKEHGRLDPKEAKGIRAEGGEKGIHTEEFRQFQ